MTAEAGEKLPATVTPREDNGHSLTAKQLPVDPLLVPGTAPTGPRLQHSADPASFGASPNACLPLTAGDGHISPQTRDQVSPTPKPALAGCWSTRECSAFPLFANRLLSSTLALTEQT